MKLTDALSAAAATTATTATRRDRSPEWGGAKYQPGLQTRSTDPSIVEVWADNLDPAFEPIGAAIRTLVGAAGASTLTGALPWEEGIRKSEKTDTPRSEETEFIFIPVSGAKKDNRFGESDVPRLAKALKSSGVVSAEHFETCSRSGRNGQTVMSSGGIVVLGKFLGDAFIAKTDEAGRPVFVLSLRSVEATAPCAAIEAFE